MVSSAGQCDSTVSTRALIWSGAAGLSIWVSKRMFLQPGDVGHAQQAVEVEITFEVDADGVEGNAYDRGIGRIHDLLAAAECGQYEFHGIHPGVFSSQLRRLVDGDGLEVPNLGPATQVLLKRGAGAEHQIGDGGIVSYG